MPYGLHSPRSNAASGALFSPQGVSSMGRKTTDCPDCAGDLSLDRRHFLRSAGLAAAVAAGAVPLGGTPRVEAAPTPESDAEKAVKGLYETLTDEQKKVVCFDWDY